MKSAPPSSSKTHRGKGYPSPAARKGKSRGNGKGHGTRASYRRNPSGFAFHAADDYDYDEAYAAADHSLYDEPFADPATGYDDEHSYDEADAYYYDDDVDYEGMQDYVDENASGDWESFTAHLTHEFSKKWSADDPIEQAELDCMVCLFEAGYTLDDPTACAASTLVGCGSVLPLAGSCATTCL